MKELSLSYGYMYRQRRYSGEANTDSRKGPATIFNEQDEESMAKWLYEMADRGIGLRPCEFHDFVQDSVKKMKRKGWTMESLACVIQCLQKQKSTYHSYSNGNTS